MCYIKKQTGSEVELNEIWGSPDRIPNAWATVYNVTSPKADWGFAKVNFAIFDRSNTFGALGSV